MFPMSDQGSPRACHEGVRFAFFGGLPPKTGLSGVPGRWSGTPSILKSCLRLQVH